MTRLVWRRAHPVRIPDRIDTAPHLEMLEAYRRDRFLAEAARIFERELELDLRDHDEAV